jgi:hypothetical protein
MRHPETALLVLQATGALQNETEPFFNRWAWRGLYVGIAIKLLLKAPLLLRSECQSCN